MKSLHAQPAPLAISRLSNGLHFSTKDDQRPSSPSPFLGLCSHGPSSFGHHHANISQQTVTESSTYAFFNHLIEQTTNSTRMSSSTSSPRSASSRRATLTSDSPHSTAHDTSYTAHRSHSSLDTFSDANCAKNSPPSLSPDVSETSNTESYSVEPVPHADAPTISDSVSTASFNLNNTSIYDSSNSCTTAPDLHFFVSLPQPPPPPPHPTAYRSLIPKLEPTTTDKRPRRVRSSRNSKIMSSASSLRSTVSSLFSLHQNVSNKKRKTVFLDLPVELIDDIMAHLDQASLRALLNVSRAISVLAIRHLYFEPVFTSTYRLAQFVTTVTHNAELAMYVKVLDLSGIKWATRKGTGEVLAGWRDWKLRNDPLSQVRRTEFSCNKTPSQQQLTDDTKRRQRSLSESQQRASKRGSASSNTFKKYSRFSKSSSDLVYVTPPSTPSTSSSYARPSKMKRKSPTSPTGSIPRPAPSSGNSSSNNPSNDWTSSPHPVQSFLLRQFAGSRDVPLGALLHLFKVCRNLLIVDLSRLPLATDYFITVPSSTTASSTSLAAKASLTLSAGYKSFPTGTMAQKYAITAQSGYLFISDVPNVPKSKLQMVLFSQLIDALADLPRLQTLNVASATWLTKELVKRLLEGCGCRHANPDEAFSQQRSSALNHLDLRDAGLARGLEWAIDGSVEELWAVFEREEAQHQQLLESNARGLLPFRRI